MLIVHETDKSMTTVDADLRKACAAHSFGVLAVHDLAAKLKEKGVEFSGKVLIFEVCNPQAAKRALEANLDVSTALPCRISAFRTPEGRTRLATVKPTTLMEVFQTPALRELAGDIERTLDEIMNEAATS